MSYSVKQLVTSWRHRAVRMAEKRLLTRLDMLPMSEHVHEDVFVAGYPKSGNTWVQLMVASLLFGLDPRLAPDHLVQDLVPDVHFRRAYRRYRTSMAFKTHELPRPEYHRVIHLVRDGRDVLVSYWHHRAAHEGRSPDIDDMAINATGMYPCSWAEHTRAWLENPFQAEVMLLRYEDLQVDARRELRRIAGFLGVDRHDDILDRIAAGASLSSMKEREKREGWANAAWPTDRPFVRRGHVGSFRDELPAAALGAFATGAGDSLRRLGYGDPATPIQGAPRGIT